MITVPKDERSNIKSDQEVVTEAYIRDAVLKVDRNNKSHEAMDILKELFSERLNNLQS